jgi:SAM-dependent methyltransferase
MTSAKTRLQHPRFAKAYSRVSLAAERRGIAAHRDRLLEELHGRVVEVGAGNGLNFARYPVAVSQVVAVEPDDHLRSLAVEAAESAPVPIIVVSGDAERLPLDGGCCDAVVASLVLCSVPDVPAALAEVWRVLRPGGELRFYEHVRSARSVYGFAEDLITPLWSRIAGGCHLNRDTAGALRAAGFDIEELDSFLFSPSPLLSQAHILGRAHKHEGQLPPSL